MFYHYNLIIYAVKVKSENFYYGGGQGSEGDFDRRYFKKAQDGRTASIVECADPEKVYIEETIPKKVELDKVYFENVSVINDFKYIFITLFRIVKR